MDQLEFNKYLAAARENATQRFSSLKPLDRWRVVRELLKLNTRILFADKFIYFAGAVFLYLLVAYIINYRMPIVNRITLGDALPPLLMIPMTVLAIFLGMQVIAAEKDKRTLETMFTIAGSPYKIWLIRFGTLHFILLLFTFGLATLTYFTFLDLPVVGATLHAYAPVYLICNLTIYFAIKFRSGLGAAMVTAGTVLLSLMLSGILGDTRFFLYFNAYADPPRQIGPETWNLWMWQNKIGVFVLGSLLLFFSLRGLLRRERLLR